MSLKLICGRSGSGKSEYCINKIIENLNSNNNKIYIITPEQFSYTVEKKLMDKIESGALLNAEVLTFKRMAYRVENEVGKTANKNLSKTGKAMLIYSILLDNKDSLKFLGKTEQNIDLVSNALTEFKKHNVSLENLKEVINSEQDRYLQEKLKDLAYIYEKYEDKIINKYIDENDILTILANSLDKTDMFKNSIIYIDEFTGFTKQEYLVIEKLLKQVKNMNVTITTDDLDMGTMPDTDIFYSNKQTADKLLYIARSNNIKCEKTLFLNDIYRFKVRELRHIEQNLYKVPYKVYEEDVKNIKLFLATNSYTEVENIAKEITKLVKNEDYRYKDISVITQDLETYSSIAKVIFNNYNIPVFIDEKRTLSQNMIIKYIMSILDIYNQSFSFDSMMNYIKSGFVKADLDDIYIFENYCKKWGIKGKKWYEGDWHFEEITDENKDQVEKIKTLRQEIVMPIANLRENLKKEKTVGNISKRLYDFLIENKVDITLTNKKDELELNGLIEKANQQELSWNIVINVLDELNDLFGDDNITFDKYMKLFKIGLNSSGLGMIPQTQDQVIFGDIERSRTHKVKAVFILGMNDGAFPSIHKEEGFLGDDDRKALKDKGIELAKGSLELLYDENFSIYKAFTTAEEKLFLSYASSNLDGNPLRPSILVSKIKKIFKNLKEESDILDSKKDNKDGKDSDDLLIINLTFDELIRNLNEFRQGKEIDSKWFEIYNFFSNNDEWKNKLNDSVKALAYTNKPEKISKENIDKLYGKTLNTTVSRLEKYKSCPFSYYLTYGLKINDEDEFKVKPIDTGSFMHDVIDTFFKLVREKQIGLKSIKDSQVEEILNEIIDEKLSLDKNYIFSSSDKYIVLAQRLKRVIFKSMKYIIEGLKQSDFEVFGSELEFKKGKTYDPIVLELDDGKKVEITGKIDRIDLAENEDGKYIRIIDYKSSVKNIDLNEVVAGLQIQLLTYLDATCKIEEMNPAGVLYFNLIDPVIKSNRSLDDEEIEEKIRKEFKMKGLILADVKVIKMMDKSLKNGYSSIIPVQLVEDGKIGKKSSTITKEQFEDLQKHTTKIIKQISKEILSGNIDIKPFYNVRNKKIPCDYCKYKMICQFKSSKNQNTYNYISKKAKDQIFEEIRNEND